MNLFQLLNKLHFQFALHLFLSVILLLFFIYKESNCMIQSLKKEEACFSMEKKAYSGQTLHQRLLAEKYYRKKKYNKASKWYQKTIPDNYKTYHHDIEDIFLDSKNRGRIFKKDAIEKLINLYKKKAEKGDISAQKFLVNIYCSEIFLEDYSLKKWYEKWKKKNWTTTSCLLKKNNLSISNNKRDKLDLYKKLALEGHTQAQYEFGKLLDKDQKRSEALKWYKKAAEKGNPEAQHKMALHFIKQAQQLEKGIKWSNKLFNQWKSPKTYLYHALLLTTQIDIKKIESETHSNTDPLLKETLKWLQTSEVLLENSMVEHYIGMYYKEVGDIKKAIEWYKKSAKNGETLSMKKLWTLSSTEEEKIQWLKEMIAYGSYGCRVCYEFDLITRNMGFLFGLNYFFKEIL